MVQGVLKIESTYPEQRAKRPVEEKLVDYSEDYTYYHDDGLTFARRVDGIAVLIGISNKEK